MKESALGRARRAARSASRSAFREAVLERDGWICRMVGIEVECAGRLHAHHVRRISQGGKDELGNGLTLCRAHHDYVHHHTGWAYEHGYLMRSGQ